MSERAPQGAWALVPVTRYFAEQVLRKRPYLTVELCEQVVRSPLTAAVKDDGRVRYWGKITLPGDAKTRILRVVTLDDGVTLHDAFIDRDYRGDRA